MLTRLINAEHAEHAWKHVIERGGSPPHLRLNLPEVVAGYWPPVGPPHFRASDLDRSGAVSLSR
jgi:hypothetical protein